jgi:hypothetical protein
MPAPFGNALAIEQWNTARYANEQMEIQRQEKAERITQFKTKFPGESYDAIVLLVKLYRIAYDDGRSHYVNPETQNTFAYCSRTKQWDHGYPLPEDARQTAH